MGRRRSSKGVALSGLQAMENGNGTQTLERGDEASKSIYNKIKRKTRKVFFPNWHSSSKAPAGHPGSVLFGDTSSPEELTETASAPTSPQLNYSASEASLDSGIPVSCLLEDQKTTETIIAPTVMTLMEPSPCQHAIILHNAASGGSTDGRRAFNSTHQVMSAEVEVAPAACQRDQLEDITSSTAPELLQKQKDGPVQPPRLLHNQNPKGVAHDGQDADMDSPAEINLPAKITALKSHERMAKVPSIQGELVWLNKPGAPVPNSEGRESHVKRVIHPANHTSLRYENGSCQKDLHRQHQEAPYDSGSYQSGFWSLLSGVEAALGSIWASNDTCCRDLVLQIHAEAKDAGISQMNKSKGEFESMNCCLDRVKARALHLNGVLGSVHSTAIGSKQCCMDRVMERALATNSGENRILEGVRESEPDRKVGPAPALTKGREISSINHGRRDCCLDPVIARIRAKNGGI